MKVLGYSYGVTDALINRLQELYPDKLPTEQVSPEDLAYLRGQQSIINKVIDLQTEEKDY